MAFDSEAYLATWRDEASFPSIHDEIAALVAAHPATGAVLDLCASTGILGQRLQDQAGLEVCAVEWEQASIDRGRSYGINVPTRQLHVTAATVDEFVAWITEHKVTGVVARRCLSDVFAGPNEALLPAPDYAFAYELCTALVGAGVRQLWLQGRAFSVRSTHPLPHTDAEISCVVSHFAVAGRSKNCAYLEARAEPLSTITLAQRAHVFAGGTLEVDGGSEAEAPAPAPPTIAALGAIERVAVADLHTHPRNPRRGNVAVIAESLRVNGQFKPLLVQRSTNALIAGNHTFEAARLIGLTHVDVLFMDVDDDVAVRIMLADNRTSDLGEYDNTTLAELLGSFESFEGTGYDDGYLDRLLGELEAERATGEAPPPDPEPERPSPYPIVFDTTEERAYFEEYLRWLAVAYPSEPTICGRLLAHLRDVRIDA